MLMSLLEKIKIPQVNYLKVNKITLAKKRYRLVAPKTLET